MAEQPKKTAHEVLASYKLPPGLLPQEVVSYTLDDQSGAFRCTLSKPVYRTLGTGPDEEDVYYAQELTGVIKELKLTNLVGVKTKQLLLWLSITKIEMAAADDEYVSFYVGLISHKLPVKWFEEEQH